MYGISTYIYHKNQLNVGKYTSPMDGMGEGRLESLGEAPIVFGVHLLL